MKCCVSIILLSVFLLSNRFSVMLLFFVLSQDGVTKNCSSGVMKWNGSKKITTTKELQQTTPFRKRKPLLLRAIQNLIHFNNIVESAVGFQIMD